MRPPHFSIFRVAKIFGADKPTTLLPHAKKVLRHTDGYIYRNPSVQDWLDEKLSLIAHDDRHDV